jgi:hypothetical protein
MGDPTSSYATAGIALRVSGAHKLHHHDKVETPSVEISVVRGCEIDGRMRAQGDGDCMSYKKVNELMGIFKDAA